MASERPISFLCIIADQMRASHMGCAGNPIVQTPHLDALAASGVRFSRAYVNNPLCMPSRATLFTGQTARGHGVRTNGINLCPGIPTMPGALCEAGYRTHSIGKIHLGTFDTPRGLDPEACDPLRFPEARYMWDHGKLNSLPRDHFGLQTADFTGGHGSYFWGDYLPWLEERLPGGLKLTQPEAGERLASDPEQAYKMALPAELHYNTWIAERAADFFGQSAQTGQPFFLWCSFPDPHHPYCPPQPWCDMYLDPALREEIIASSVARREGELDSLPPHYRRMFEHNMSTSGRHGATRMRDEQLADILALTYGSISFMDSQIGRVMQSLEDTGLRESTVVVFLADHGDMMGDHWIINKGPFHFDGLLNVPMIWSLPGQVTAGRTSDALFSLLDFAPTILDLAGVPIPEGEVPATPECPAALPPWPGVSARPVLTGAADRVQESVIVENDEDYLGLRLRTLVTERYHLTSYPGQPYGELFDLHVDPRQLHNLWDSAAHQDPKRDLLVQLMERLVLTDSRLPRRLTHA